MSELSASPAGAVSRPTLNIQFFVNFIHLGGTYFRFQNLAVGLVRKGHNVSIYAADHNSKSTARLEDRDGVQYHIVPEMPTNRLFGVCCDLPTITRRIIYRYPPCDVAHLFQPFPSAAAGWARSRASVRFYDWDDLWAGGLLGERPARWRDVWPWRATRYLEARLPKWADHVTAASGFLADRARQVGARAVSEIYNGCWQAPYPDRTTARRCLGLREDALYAGFMGRTDSELPWCFEALAACREAHPRLRLAVCGANESRMSDLPPDVRGRIDYLGQLTPEQTRSFAAAIDLGLLPLADNPFNQSRFPIKFSEHLATGVPLLCSTVGEVARLAGRFAWALTAGKTREEWVAAFRRAIDRLAAGDIPPFDEVSFHKDLSWEGLSVQLAALYRSVLQNAEVPCELTNGSRS